MAPTGMQLQNLTAWVDRKLLILPLNIFTAILYMFVLVTALSFISNGSYPSPVFTPDAAVVRSGISSLPSFCFIKCEEGGGEVCWRQGDCVCTVPCTIAQLWFRAP